MECKKQSQKLKKNFQIFLLEVILGKEKLFSSVKNLIAKLLCTDIRMQEALVLNHSHACVNEEKVVTVINLVSTCRLLLHKGTLGVYFTIN